MTTDSWTESSAMAVLCADDMEQCVVCACWWHCFQARVGTSIGASQIDPAAETLQLFWTESIVCQPGVSNSCTMQPIKPKLKGKLRQEWSGISKRHVMPWLCCIWKCFNFIHVQIIWSTYGLAYDLALWKQKHTKAKKSIILLRGVVVQHNLFKVQGSFIVFSHSGMKLVTLVPVPTQYPDPP